METTTQRLGRKDAQAIFEAISPTPYHALIFAIAKEQATDYIKAVRSMNMYRGYGGAYELRAHEKLESIERWFNSNLFRLAIDIDPQWLIEELERVALSN